MVNIGPRPTFDPADAPAKLEAHLFDTKAPELYGATAEITFVEKLRDVQKFESADALVDQLGMDATAAKRILGYT
jgi:riboflavin kinase/FMN adenylyltransferase